MKLKILVRDTRTAYPSPSILSRLHGNGASDLGLLSSKDWLSLHACAA
jgi:hypothetical protein